MIDLATQPGSGPIGFDGCTDLRTQGYSILRDVFPKSQIEALREELNTYFARAGQFRFGGKYGVRGLHTQRGVAGLLENEVFLGMLKRFSFPQAPVLTGACDLMSDTTSTWHKDITPDMNLGDDIYGDPDFRVYKVAIYLQDQASGSRQVLKVRPGSQCQRNGSGLPAQDLPVRVGDVCVFDVRIDHVGLRATWAEKAVRILTRGLARLTGADADHLYTRARELYYGRIRHQPRRLAVFLTFGPDGVAVQRYEAACREWNGPVPTALDRSTVDLLHRHGILALEQT